MRLEHDQTTHPRLLRKPALGEVSAGTRIKSEKKSENPRGSRFVGATHLDDHQKAQICNALKAKQVGDEIGRQIFIGAVEYQLSTFANSLSQRSEPERRPRGLNAALEKTLQAIVEKARALSLLLRDLPDSARAKLTGSLTSQDARGRGYDDRYLCELGLEIDRLEQACTAVSDDLEPEAAEPDPAPSRDFVAKLADIFSECFEMPPTAAEDGPFRTSLEVLSEVTGLMIGSEPEFLEQILAGENGKR
jgi:hypothetical protein